MDGTTFAKICDMECTKRGISKADFYKAIGVSAASFTGWRKGAVPSERYLRAVEDYFGIDLADYEEKDEVDVLRDALLERQDLRILLNSATAMPPSSVYALISQIEKMKEESN